MNPQPNTPITDKPLPMDYVITFVYGDERNKVRVNNSPSERDAIVSAKVKARLFGYPIDENNIKIRLAAYQKKQP